MKTDQLRLRGTKEAIQRIDKHTVRGKTAFGAREQHTEMPWGQSIGMRHILVHHHFGIDEDAVWTAATHNLPALKAQVAAILLGIENPETKQP